MTVALALVQRKASCRCSHSFAKICSSGKSPSQFQWSIISNITIFTSWNDGTAVWDVVLQHEDGDYSDCGSLLGSERLDIVHRFSFNLAFLCSCFKTIGQLSWKSEKFLKSTWRDKMNFYFQFHQAATGTWLTWQCWQALAQSVPDVTSYYAVSCILKCLKYCQ